MFQRAIADFNVDSEKGLTGFCDFIISSSSERLFVSAPVMMLVEAKKEDIISGLGQCVAEMVAAQIFNEREGNEIPVELALGQDSGKVRIVVE